MKNSFVLYLDYKQHLDLIQDDGDFRRLIEAIFNYCETGQEPSDLSAVSKMAFSFIRSNLDRDNEKYEAAKEKRKEAGRLGGVAKASNARNAKQNVANASNAKQSLANVAVTVTGIVDCNNTPLTPHGGDAFGDAGDSPLAGQTGSPDGGKPRAQRKRFVPPTVEEVADYCRERQNGINPEAFVDFYTAKGWLVGKSPMKDWRSAVRTWEHERRSQSRPAYQMPIN